VELKRRGKTIIFSTHMMDNAERMCDAVCIIAHGDKVLDGPVARVKQEHGTRNVALTLGDGTGTGGAVGALLADRSLVSRVDDHNRNLDIELAPSGDAQRLLRELVALGANITRFELVQPSLHQIFLERVGARGVEPGMSGHG
jgi:ABC-2 type transport system ATP-binding protein